MAPLHEGSVESAEILAESEAEQEIRTSISSQERPYFRGEYVETTREMDVVGTFISLNKETNRGTFKLGDGRNVRYHYDGEDRDSFHRDFGLKGPVRAVGEVTFDDNLSPVHFEIHSVRRLQPRLPFPPEKPS